MVLPSVSNTTLLVQTSSVSWPNISNILLLVSVSRVAPSPSDLHCSPSDRPAAFASPCAHFSLPDTHMCCVTKASLFCLLISLLHVLLSTWTLRTFAQTPITSPLVPRPRSTPDHSQLPTSMLLECKPDQGTCLVKAHLSLTPPHLHDETPRPQPGIRASFTSILPIIIITAHLSCRPHALSCAPKCGYAVIEHPSNVFCQPKTPLRCNLSLEAILGIQGKVRGPLCPLTHTPCPMLLLSSSPALTTLNWNLLVSMTP